MISDDQSCYKTGVIIQAVVIFHNIRNVSVFLIKYMFFQNIIQLYNPKHLNSTD